MTAPKQPIKLGNREREKTEKTVIILEDSRPIECVFTSEEIEEMKKANSHRLEPWLWVFV